MKTYTAFFPKDEEMPPELQSAEHKEGDLKVIDGIAVTEHEGIFGFLLGSENQTEWVPFSKTNPPEIINDYVFSCDMEAWGERVAVARAKDTLPRHYTKKHTPVLLRIHTRCAAQCEKRGFADVREGEYRPVCSGFGISPIPKGGSAVWTDSLVIASLGVVIQIRPAGLTDPVEWIISYGSIGVTFQTLEQYLNKPA